MCREEPTICPACGDESAYKAKIGWTCRDCGWTSAEDAEKLTNGFVQYHFEMYGMRKSSAKDSYFEAVKLMHLSDMSIGNIEKAFNLIVTATRDEYQD